MPTDNNEKRQIFALNTIALAYLGDAVYEVFVRERLMRCSSITNQADRLHKAGVAYVCAAAQAKIIEVLLPDLTEEERALVMRARNHKIATKPKNADPMDYKWATAFEALIGALHLAGEEERCTMLMERAAAIAEEERDK